MFPHTLLMASPEMAKHYSDERLRPPATTLGMKATRQQVFSGQLQQTQFSGAPPHLKPAAIQWDGFSKWAPNIFKIWPLNKLVSKEPTFWNLSINDWMIRFYQIFGLYLPQAYNASKKDRHKIETNGRNAVIWTGTLLLTLLTKHDKFSINALLNQFMKPQGTPYQLAKNELAIAREHLQEIAEKMQANPPVKPWRLYRLDSEGNIVTRWLKWRKVNKEARKTEKLQASLTRKQGRLEKTLETLLKQHGNETKAAAFKGSRFHQWVNKIRLEYDYYEILQRKEVGIHVAKSDYRKAYWSSLNKLDVDKLLDRLHMLQQAQAKKTLNAIGETELKALGKFLNRMNTFKNISTATLTALTVYVVGTLLMKFIFRYIAPLDHDFDPDRVPANLRKRIKTHSETELHAPQSLMPLTARAQPFILPSHANQTMGGNR
ncbi:MAG: hypothetical protein VKJ04_02085 [Vampirovibrionales bacterium]|nr:hypothetical protein [Vampirovibrionales bacterium]